MHCLVRTVNWCTHWYEKNRSTPWDEVYALVRKIMMYRPSVRVGLCATCASTGSRSESRDTESKPNEAGEASVALSVQGTNFRE